METMLYFGSFNPVHKGHIAIAEWVLDQGLCEEVWFVVSPRSPFKRQEELAEEQHRLEMVRTAAGESSHPDRIRACGIEFDLPKPSYTVDTLQALEERYPNRTFSILIGEDNVSGLPRWKGYDRFIRKYRIWYYPRSGGDGTKYDTPAKVLPSAPLLDYSATEIRRRLRLGEPVEEMVTPGVYRYIEKHGLWTCTTDCKTK